jgi:hypothetical protein
MGTISIDRGGEMLDKVAKVRHYRSRALEMRASANNTDDPELRQKFMEIASDYEELARETEELIASRRKA